MNIWHGLRITLSCAHMKLLDQPRAEDASHWVIGAPSACWVCPARQRIGGGQVAATRLIVDVTSVCSPRQPESLDPIHWYWEGRGH